jgi:hypothetical protein
MNLADELLRHRLLTNGPVGLWRTMPGSHTQLFDDLIDFRQDGSGEMRTRSAMHGTHTLRFVWRVAGHGVVECQPVYDVPEMDDHGQPEAADWFRLVFAFEQSSSDVGSHWVLKERDAPGFWELNAPLVPVEPGLRGSLLKSQ